MRGLGIALVAALLVACESEALDDGLVVPDAGPGGAVGLSIQAYHAAAHAKVCDLLDDCCLAGEVFFLENCTERQFRHDFDARDDERLVASGTVQWDPLAAEACVAAFDTLTCDDLVSTNYRLAPCEGALVFPADPPRTCKYHPCDPGEWCDPTDQGPVCKPDRAEGAECRDDPASCGGRQRCRKGVQQDPETCQPRLCDGDTTNDDRTELTDFYRAIIMGGHSREVYCWLPPDGFFLCECRIDGVESTCRSQTFYSPGTDFSAYECC